MLHPSIFGESRQPNLILWEGNISKVYLEKDNIGEDSSDEGLTIGTTATDTVETTSENTDGSDGEKHESKEDER